jgi:site-specific DNA-cytosine methylase
VRGWDEPARTVAGSGTNGGFGVADPRVALEHSPYRGSLGVNDWEKPAPTVRGKADARTSPSSIADPRIALDCTMPERHRNKYAVGEWVGAREDGDRRDAPWVRAAAVADPRPASTSRSVPLTLPVRNGIYGVLSWQQAAATVTGSASIDNGSFAVADPRKPLTGPVPVIIAADGTWHRPLTTLELAVLQGLPAVLDGVPLALHGTKIAAWRERVGNAVPVGAARAIAETILKALLAAALGTWFLSPSGEPIWVREDGLREDEVDPELMEATL